MKYIAENINFVEQRILAAEHKYGRRKGSVKLLVVSKSQSIEAIQRVAAAGLTRFGENYLQEAMSKINMLEHAGVTWDFIGPIQSNKTKILAQRFDWIHSLDRAKTAQRLSDSRPANKEPINVCIQVNISNENSKSGILPQNAKDFADFVVQLPGLRLRGLMTVPAIQVDFKQQVRVYNKLWLLFEKLKASGLNLDTLSMGMSNDLEAAIAEGSTIVRVGSAIFSARHP